MMFGSHKIDRQNYKKDFQFKQLTDSVWLIPGENAGTYNSFHLFIRCFRAWIFMWHKCIHHWKRKAEIYDRCLHKKQSKVFVKHLSIY